MDFLKKGEVSIGLILWTQYINLTNNQSFLSLKLFNAQKSDISSSVLTPNTIVVVTNLL